MTYYKKLITTTVHAHDTVISFRDYIGCGVSSLRYGTIARNQIEHGENVFVKRAINGEEHKVSIPYEMIDYAVVTESVGEVDEMVDRPCIIPSICEVIPVSIEITTPPTKMSYVDGETIDVTGMVVSAYAYDETLWGYVPLYEITVSPETAEYTDGTQTITISWTNSEGTVLTTTYTIAVIQIPVRIDITTLPTKLTYVEGESVDITGMVVKAYAQDDTEYAGFVDGIIPNSELTIDPATIIGE